MPEEEAEVAPLSALLRTCGQTEDRVEPMASALARWLDAGAVRKIGEGTFGEAFKCPGVVLKIVPMGGDVLVNGERQKGAKEMLAEAAIALRLSALRGHADAAKAESKARPLASGSAAPRSKRPRDPSSGDRGLGPPKEKKSHVRRAAVWVLSL